MSDSMFPSVFSEDRMIDGGESTEMCEIGPETFATPEVSLPLTREGLIGAQRGDPSLEKCFAAVVADSSECREGQCFLVENGVLMRKWSSHTGAATDETGEGFNTVYQIVVPVSWRKHVLELAHEHLWSGHLGITKTYGRVLKHFFWPGMKSHVINSISVVLIQIIYILCSFADYVNIF